MKESILSIAALAASCALAGTYTHTTYTGSDTNLKTLAEVRMRRATGSNERRTAEIGRLWRRDSRSSSTWIVPKDRPELDTSTASPPLTSMADWRILSP